MGRAFPWLYDLLMAPVERLGLRRWRRATVAPARGRVLEVGAGTGLNLPYYRAAELVVVTDPDGTMLRRAVRRRRRAARPALYFAAADAQALPFPDGAFDAVVATLAFCTIPEPRRAFAELRRVTRPGGEIHLLEHVRSPRRWLARLQDRITPCWRRVAQGCHPNREPLVAARRAGLVVEETVTALDGLLLRARLRRPAEGTG